MSINLKVYLERKGKKKTGKMSSAYTTSTRSKKKKPTKESKDIKFEDQKNAIISAIQNLSKMQNPQDRKSLIKEIEKKINKIKSNKDRTEEVKELIDKLADEVR